MAINPDFKRRVRNFIKDHYKPVLIVVGIILALAIINRIMILNRYKGTPQTTYIPNVPVLDLGDTTVPTNVVNEFEQFIKDYIGYCNNRNYVAAWNMVSEDCKKNNFDDSYEEYVSYVQRKFTGNTKRYAIQNYSNINGKYIYNVKIFDDFLATGLTNMGYGYQEEKFTISYDNNKKLVCAVGNYIDARDINYMISNDYLRVEASKLIEKYNFQIYRINFINRTNNIIVVQDGRPGDWEIGLAIGNEIRATIDNDTKIILGPGESTTVELAFEKFYDSSNSPKGIIFNTVRVMEDYTYNADYETGQAEIESAIDKFTMTIAF